jgi:hypothetical protein
MFSKYQHLDIVSNMFKSLNETLFYIHGVVRNQDICVPVAYKAYTQVHVHLKYSHTG